MQAKRSTASKATLLRKYVWVYTAMATPAFLRYLPARLKPLSSPAVWAPLTVFALLSIFLWEYHKNPEWFNRQQISNVNPDSELTLEEQARLSEIDTIDLLLESARIPGADARAAASQNVGNGNLDVPADGSEVSSPSLASQSNPFAAYEEEYKFPGSSNPATGAARPASPDNAPRFGSASAPATPSSSALAEAIRQQNAASARSNQRDGQNSQPTTAGTSSAASSSAISSDNSSATSELAPAQAPSNGITVPFTQTTLDMSPPAGTTGYQTPASSQLPVFNTPSQQPTSNPFSNNASRSAFPQPNGFQPVAPIAPPLPGAAAPSSNGFTPPSFAQPEQNRRVR